MFKKVLVGIAALIASIGFAFAQVDVNKADQAGLDGIKGIGPSIAKKIIDERTKGGNFKDWPDLEKRVKGIGAKNAVKFSQAGLTVNNQPLAGAPASAPVSAAKAAPATATAAAPAKDSKAKSDDKAAAASAPVKK